MGLFANPQRLEAAIGDLRRHAAALAAPPGTPAVDAADPTGTDALGRLARAVDAIPGAVGEQLEIVAVAVAAGARDVVAADRFAP